MILTILGLPDSDFDRMLTLTQELFGSEDPEFARPAEQQQRQLAVVMDFVEYSKALATDRRAHPTDDLASVVANGSLHGVRLSSGSGGCDRGSNCS